MDGPLTYKNATDSQMNTWKPDTITSRQHVFNSQKFHYIAYSSSLSSIRYNHNVYANPNMEIINPSDNVLDLGIFMSSNCSFEFHINNLCKKCSHSSGWALRTFTTRDSITMMTLFKSLVLSRLDYGSQSWSPHLVKHIEKLEKIQRSFTEHITGLHGLEYSEQLVSLKLYSIQRRRERYCIIYVWKIIEGLVHNFSKPLFVLIQSAEEDHALFHVYI